MRSRIAGMLNEIESGEAKNYIIVTDCGHGIKTSVQSDPLSAIQMSEIISKKIKEASIKTGVPYSAWKAMIDETIDDSKQYTQIKVKEDQGDD